MGMTGHLRQSGSTNCSFPGMLFSQGIFASRSRMRRVRSSMKMRSMLKTAAGERALRGLASQSAPALVALSIETCLPDILITLPKLRA